MRVRGELPARALLESSLLAFRAAGDPRALDDSTATLVDGPLVEARGPAPLAKEISVSTRMAGVTTLVLLIACANVASLLLVRASRRQREIAVRLALGVSKGRLFSQLVTESVALGLLGSMCALAIAYMGGKLLRTMLLPEIAWARSALEPRIVLFTVGSALLCAVIAGVAPVVQSLRTDFGRALRAGARDGTRQSFARAALLVAQGALSVVLLVGAMLFVRTYDNVRSMPLGFDARQMVWTRVDAGDSAGTRVTFALREAATRMARVPGVRAATIASGMPMAGGSSGEITVPGRDTVVRGVFRNNVAANFFQTTGISFVEGRPFTADEVQSRAPVVVLSQAAAGMVFPGESAIGKCVGLRRNASSCSTVVGVTRDTRAYQIFETRQNYHIYVPLTEDAGYYSARYLIVNADSRHAEEVRARTLAELKQLLPGVEGIYARTTAAQIEPQYRPWKVGAQIFSAFGVLALVVAAIGVYAVVSYSVSQRTHEMGVRIALGARISDMLNLVVGEGLRVVALGVVIGIVVALALGRLVAAYLFGVTSRDPFVILGAAAVLTGVGLVASLIPAWRAARVDPINSLRSD
jgi:predicted permease